MLALMRGEGTAHIPFAPPFLRDGAVIVSHTAAILLYLGGRIELAPADEEGRLWTHQLQLTITDIVQEVYNSHHPIDEDKWFHEQEAEAIARAAVFRRDRMPKFLGWFEGILQGNPRERTTWSADPPPMQICPCSSWSKDCVRVSSCVRARAGKAAARDSAAQGGRGTAATKGLSGERTARSVQGDSDLPSLCGAGCLARKALM
jgi:hypothetical protein